MCSTEKIKGYYERLRDSLLKAAFWVLLIVGLILTGLGVKFGTDSSSFFYFLKMVGQTMLGAGFFSVVLKSLQFNRVFEKEIEKVVFGDTFLKSRKDLPMIWAKLANSYFNNPNPSFTKTATETLVNRYLEIPDKDQFYYKDAKIFITLDWEDKENGIINMHEKLFYDIYLLNDRVTINSVGRLLTSGLTHSPPEITIDEEPPKELKLHEVDPSVLGEDVTHFEIILDKKDIKSDKNCFSIAIDRNKTIAIFSDPSYKMYFRYTHNMDVTTESKEEDLMYTFESAGTPHRFSRLKGGLLSRCRYFSYKGLMLPGQGFIMTFMRRIKDQD